MESLSSYARQFLGQMDKPDVDFIEGLSPAISIDQKSASRNPRSTVGTVTEIYDYLRLLYARVGRPHCPKCGRPLVRQTPQQIVDRVLDLPEGTRFQVLAPLVRGRKGEYEALLDDLAKQGFARARVDGEVVELTERAAVALARYEQHTIEVIVDRLVRRDGIRQRLTESMETALRLAGGIAEIGVVQEDGTEELLTFSEHLACTFDDLSFEEPEPRNFSFNSPYGACPTCDGLGTQFEVDPELVVPDPTKTLAGGALIPWAGGRSRWFDRMLEAIADEHGFSVKTRWDKLRKADHKVILYGSGAKQVQLKYRNRHGPPALLRDPLRGRGPLAPAPPLRVGLRRPCGSGPRPSCARSPARPAAGPGSKPESLAVTVGGRNIHELCSLSITAASAEVDVLELTEREHLIADRVLREVQARLRFLLDVGLDYLSMARGTATLSGGEGQRIRLASQIGSGLVGVLYVLDEPSIGLHQRDNKRLLETLVRLRDLGNTVIVVEHDEETIRGRRPRGRHRARCGRARRRRRLQRGGRRAAATAPTR